MKLKKLSTGMLLVASFFIQGMQPTENLRINDLPDPRSATNSQTPILYNCPNGCGKQFTRSYSSKVHAATTVCPNQPNPIFYNCPLGCPEQFTTPNNAYAHARQRCPNRFIATNSQASKRYKCPNKGCEKEFSRQEIANRHAKIKCPNRLNQGQAESVPVATPHSPAAADAGPADTDLSIPAIEYLCPVCDMPLPDKNSRCANGICPNSLLPDQADDLYGNSAANRRILGDLQSTNDPSDDRRSAKRHHPDTTASSHTNKYECPRCEMTFANEESFEGHYFEGGCTV